MGQSNRLERKRSCRRGAVLRTLGCGAAIAVVLFCATGVPARAVTTSTTAAPTTTTEFAPQGAAKTQVDELTAKAQAVQAQLEELNEQLELKSEEYNKCQDDLDAANAKISELRRTVEDAQRDKAQRQALLAQRLKSVYMSGGRDQLLQILIASNGLEDLYNRVRLVSTLADQDKRLVSDLKDSAAKLDMLIKAADDQKAEALKLRDQLAITAKEIQSKIAVREQTLASLDSRVRDILTQEQQRQAAEQARLQAELQAKLDAALLAAQAHILNGGQIYQGELPQADDKVANQLIQTAAAYLGVPYVWGGSKPSTGMDCSGFVRYVFKQHGVKLPHYSGYMAQMGIPVDLKDIKPGDLIAFGFPVHLVGIYIGDGLYIHTPSQVMISKLSNRHDLAAIRRFPIEMRTGDPLFD